ncbi:hypothetical protein RQP46_010117 [Phenoliferia psychrophenolica]
MMSDRAAAAKSSTTTLKQATLLNLSTSASTSRPSSSSAPPPAPDAAAPPLPPSPPILKPSSISNRTRQRVRFVVPELDEYEIVPGGEGDDEEEDGFGGALGDGALGEEEDEDGSGLDEDSDDEDEVLPDPAAPKDSAAPPSKKRRRTQGSCKHPEWLEAAFKSRVAWPRSTQLKGSPLTALYRRPSATSPTFSAPELTKLALGTFVLPRIDDFFLLDQHDPNVLYNPNWFFWDPIVLVESLHCPTCKSVGKESKLTRDSFSSRPRRAVDLGNVWYLIGTAFSVLRGVLNMGLGTKQFSNLLRALALRNHEQKEPFGSFIDRTRNSGYVPTGKWLSEVYNTFIEASATITKHIVKVNGVSVFVGLLTITNERGEIRSINLVPTKAQSQYAPALGAMRVSLNRYGHDQPVLFYTDNLQGDAPFLRRAFPSLKFDVHPLVKWGELDPLVLPDATSPTIINTAALLSSTLLKIVSEIDEQDPASQEVVGLDTEHNVTQVLGPNGGVISSQADSHLAILQLAWRDRVFIVQLATIVQRSSTKTLPTALRQFLENDRIKKVGVGVKGDVTRLAKEFSSAPGKLPTPAGAVELGQLAKERGVTAAKLSELCAVVLPRRLKRPRDIQISSRWTEANLAPEYVEYAALDAYVGLAIYRDLLKQPKVSTTALSDSACKIGALVVLLADDSTRPIAHGVIAELAPPSTGEPKVVDGIRLTQARLVLRVTRILVPAQAQPEEDDEEDQQQEEGAERIGDVFDAFGAREGNVDSSSERDPASEQLGLDILAQAASSLANLFASRGKAGPIVSRVLLDPWHMMDRIYIPRQHGARRAFMRAYSDTLFVPDPVDRALISARLEKQGSSWEEQLRRNPKWIWQRCKRTIPPPEVLHPLLSELFQTFGPIIDAKKAIPLFNATGWAEAKKVLDTVAEGGVSDPPGIPLYFCIGRCGGASGLLDDGVRLYRCCRGTVATEGGVHRNIRDRFPISGVSVRHAAARLKDYTLYHNLVVGTFNRSGVRYVGHFDLWLGNSLQLLRERTADLVKDSELVAGWVNGDCYEPSEESFGILPVPSTVLDNLKLEPYSAPVVLSTKRTRRKRIEGEELAPLPRSDLLTPPPRWDYLASKQGCRFALLHVHTQAERDLFKTLINDPVVEHFENVSGGSMKWVEMARKWTAQADGQQIFYKHSPCHLGQADE